MPSLAVADRLAGQRCGATHLAAQLADDSLLALVYVYALAYQWGALAIDTAVAIGGQRSDAAPQQEALELLDVGVR